MSERRNSFDLLVVGGGVNGAGIACDAAGRGLSVLLCEMKDLAGATSSASSKLIHGGLRYLEYYEFRLVREALAEREVILFKAPHIAWPLRFILPHRNTVRPRWVVRTGLFIYDNLGEHPRLPGSVGVDFRRSPAGAPLKDSIVYGFEYSDGWIDDARLVVLNAISAASHGGHVATRTELTAARRVGGAWEATLRDADTGTTRTVRARALVNATGPWVKKVAEGPLALNGDKGVRLVKGSHIVVPRIYDGAQAFILQNDDRRVIFVIPYEERFSLIGTTDIAVDAPSHDMRITDDEVRYLCDVVNKHFRHSISPADVVWSYAGVRPLFDDRSDIPSAVTRDYVLEVEDDGGRAPVVSIYGGKITTYRYLAERVMEKLSPYFKELGKPWTAKTPLPGGDIPGEDFERFVAALEKAYPALDPVLLRRLARRHGTLTYGVLGDAKRMGDLGAEHGPALFEREVDYFVRNEWARAPEDILWRRTKCGLHMTAEQRDAFAESFSRRNG